MTRVSWGGITLELLAGRAAWWPAESALLIADPHFGKSGTFRAAGVPVPSGVTGDDLGRLAALVQRTGAARVVILGDFFHARAGRSAALHDALAQWRAAHAPLEVVLVRGNHDRHAGDPPAELGIRCVAEPFGVAGVALRHHPVDEAATATVAGHLHPTAVLRGATGMRHRLPCFWFSGQQLVLPAFGGFTGGADIEAQAGDRVYVIAGGDVIAVK